MLAATANVWQWVQNCWSDEKSEPAPIVPGTSVAPCRRRVTRGGSWRSRPKAMQLDAHNAFPPELRRDTIGFRLVRELR